MVVKMKIALVLSLAAALFVPSCSAEVVDRLDAVASITVDEDAVFELEEISSRRIEVRFSPVPYAKRYAYQITNGEFTIASALSYEDGLNVISISGIQVSNGNLALYASLDAGADVGDGSWVLLANEAFALPLWQEAPVAYVAFRDSNSVTIAVSATSQSMIYSGELSDSSGVVVTISFMGQSTYTIEDLDPDTEYTLVLHHVNSENGELGEGCSVSIPKYDVSIVMTISAADDGFVVQDVPDGVASVTLYRASSPGGSAVALATVPVEGGRALVPYSSLASLDTGYFHFQSGSYRSFPLQATTHPVAKTVTTTRKSASVLFDFAASFNADDYELSISGSPNASVSMLGDRSGVLITGLDSNTEYSSLKLQFTEKAGTGLTYSCAVPTFRTGSFVGRYIWQGKLSGGKNPETSYVIRVEAAPSGSKAPYYIYVDKSDPILTNSNVTGDNLRIMPLVDSSTGEPMPSSSNQVSYSTGMAGSLDLTKQNQAYRANSIKWNHSSMSPSSWYIVDGDSNPAKDIVTTTTMSVAIFFGSPLNNEVITTFSLAERTLEDGSVQPYVVFVNVPGQGMAGFGLYKNANPQTEFGTLENPDYTWILTPVEEGQ